MDPSRDSLTPPNDSVWYDDAAGKEREEKSIPSFERTRGKLRWRAPLNKALSLRIAMRNTVLASLETEDRTQCVDFFLREDGTFGFELYRGEYDGPSRWLSLGKYSHLSFASGQEALLMAKQHVSWLNKAEVWRW